MSQIKLSNYYIKNIVKLALNEDLYPSGDITSNLVKNSKIIKVKLISNQQAIVAGLGFCILLLLLTLAVLGLVVKFELAPAVEAILSLAPGGQAELVVMALIAGADMGFVVSHHLLRIFIVILGAPILARIMRAKPPR